MNNGILESQPLVSVRVVTYRSGKTVVETLESIKAQTYRNIELVVSDDCSPDDTVEVCRKWIEDNRGRFVNVELVTSNVNTGISSNANRGARCCHGVWIKGIAGDDMLIPTAIEDYIKFANECPGNVRIIESQLELFCSEGAVPESRIQEYEGYFRLENRPYQEQWKHCLQENIFVGPGYFYTRELFNEIGGFSSEYKNGEEWPFVYKVLKTGARIYCVDKKLVRYRMSLNSISHKTDKKGLRNRELVLSTCRFFFDHPFKDLIKEHHYLIAWDRFLFYKTMQMHYECGGTFWTGFLMNFSKYLSPYGYWKGIKRLFKKEQ